MRSSLVTYLQRDVEDALFVALTPQQRAELRDILIVVRNDLTDVHEQCATPAALDRQ